MPSPLNCGQMNGEWCAHRHKFRYRTSCSRRVESHQGSWQLQIGHTTPFIMVLDLMVFIYRLDLTICTCRPKVDFLGRGFRNLEHYRQQGRINHCASCTMGGPPAARWPPDQLPNFYHNVLTFERLKRSDDWKKVVNFWEKKSALPAKILAMRMRKGPPPHVGMGPRMVNPALTDRCM